VAIEFATVDKISNPDTRKLDEVEDDPPTNEVIIGTEDD
jgi:hypothetical protein